MVQLIYISSLMIKQVQQFNNNHYLFKINSIKRECLLYFLKKSCRNSAAVKA